MENVHEFFPFEPGDRVVVNKAGEFLNDVGKVDTIDLKTGEVLVKMDECNQYELFHVDDLDKLA